MLSRFFLQFPGEALAFALLEPEGSEELSCAACGQRRPCYDLRYAVCFGQPVAVCDAECLEMLKANWQPIKGRV